MKIFSPVVVGDVQQAGSSLESPQTLHSVTVEEKDLISKLGLRADGSLTVQGIPVDKAAGSVSASVVSELPTEGLYTGLKCIVENIGTFIWDGCKDRWVQVRLEENAYDIVLSVYDGYAEGEVVCSATIPRAVRLADNLRGTVVVTPDANPVAEFELYLDSYLLATITFNGTQVAEISGLPEGAIVDVGESLHMKSVSGVLSQLTLALKAELLSA